LNTPVGLGDSLQHQVRRGRPASRHLSGQFTYEHLPNDEHAL